MTYPVLGLDGCPGGWAGALVSDTGVQWRRYDGWQAGFAAALAEPVAQVAVDVPIGLPDLGETRHCDRLARRQLGRRGASVFAAPPRALLTAPSHAAASARSRTLCGHGISIQAFGIYSRIAAVDEIMTGDLQARVIETHPELSFQALGGEASCGDFESKHLSTGRSRRELALKTVLPPFDLAERPARVRADDALDALACAWTARRWLDGDAWLLPAEPAADERGLLMAITG